MRRAAAQRLNADGAGACVRIEHARVLDAQRQNIEKRLAKFVRRRTQPIPFRRQETAALQGS